MPDPDGNPARQDINRRSFVRSAAVPVALPIESASDEITGAGTEDAPTFVVEQGSLRKEMEPIMATYPVEEYLVDLSDIRPARSGEVGIEAAINAPDTSEMALFLGSDGLSLVFGHERGVIGAEGSATFNVRVPDGHWAVNYGAIISGGSVSWSWNDYAGAGSAYRFDEGAVDDGFSVGIGPQFESGIDTWRVVRGAAGPPVDLDLTRSVAIYTEDDGGSVPPPDRPDPDPPRVVDVGRAPTAVEIDEPVTATITLDADSRLQEEFTSEATATVTRRGESLTTVEGTLDVAETDDGNYECTLSFPPAADLTDDELAGILPQGLGYELTLALSTEEFSYDDFEDHDEHATEMETYAFLEVSPTDLIPAKANDSESNDLLWTGDELFEKLRTRTEEFARYCASGLGTMGAHGLDFNLITDVDSDRVDDGWLVLPYDLDEYFDHTNYEDDEKFPIHNERERPDLPIAEQAVTLADRDPDIEIAARDEETTVFVSTEESLQGPSGPLAYGGFYWGGPIAEGMWGELEGLVFARIGGGAWTHEIGHHLDFPDLYLSDSAPLRAIGEWGPMGAGDVYTAYCKGAHSTLPDQYARQFDTETWLEPVRTAVDGRTVVNPFPLTGKEVGDEMRYVFSEVTETTVFEYENEDGEEVEYVIEEGVDDSYYVVESRRSGDTDIRTPELDDTYTRSPDPSGNDGIALYWAGIYDPTKHEGSNDPLDPQLQYMPPSWESFDDVVADDPTHVTLPYGSGSSFHDSLSSLTFELLSELVSTTTEPVEVRVDAHPTIRSTDTDNMTTYVVSRSNGFPDSGPEAPAGTAPPAVPGLDLLAETPDGRRVGVDPGSGTLVNEVDGATVTSTGADQRISVPSGVDVTVTVSAERLKSALRDHGETPPETITYDRTAVVESAPEVVTDGDATRIEGRLKRVSTAAVDDRTTTAVPATVDIEPPRINADSEGKFVTAYVAFGGDVRPGEIQVESVLLETIQVVTDDQYGFVRNPPVEERDGREYVMVKFWRDEIIDGFELGEHEPVLSGNVDGVSFATPAVFELFEPDTP